MSKLRNRYNAIRTTWYDWIATTPGLREVDNWWYYRSPNRVGWLMRELDEKSGEIYQLEQRVVQLESAVATLETVQDRIVKPLLHAKRPQ